MNPFIKKFIKNILIEEINNNQIDLLLNQIIDLNLRNAPRLEVMTVTANDLEGYGTNQIVRLPNTLASYETMQKYIVPYNGKIRIPVPTEDNWDIYELTLEQLSELVEELKNMINPEFDDIYRIAERIGKFLFQYYN